MVLEEDGGPAVGGRANKVLCAGHGAFEVGECPVFGSSLEFIGSLTYIDDVLVGDGLVQRRRKIGNETTYKLENHV